jgi:hypothetical protein
MDPNNPANQGGVPSVPIGNAPFVPQDKQGNPVQQPAEPAVPPVQSAPAETVQSTPPTPTQPDPQTVPVAPADLPPPPVFTPVSSAQGKEFAPVPTVQHEGLRASEVEPELHPEVAEAGVEKVSEVPKLTLEDQKAGIELAKETTPVPSQSPYGISLPIPPQQAVVIAKKGNVKDSIAWLATLLLRQLKIVRMNKKESHG